MHISRLTDKLVYKEFCSQHKDIPVFSQYWWLDALCGSEQWDILAVYEGVKIIATMPYITKKKFGFTICSQPLLTQTLGPYLIYPLKADYGSRLSYEKKILTLFIQALPKFDFFIQNFHHSVTNWLPFHWAGFSQTTRYTYVIEDLSDFEQVVSNFSYSKRKTLKKARENLVIKYEMDPLVFYQHHKCSLAAMGVKINYQYSVFERLFKAGLSNNAVEIIAAFDQDNALHAALFIVWDSKTSYNLISSIDPRFRSSGASSLIVEAALLSASKRLQSFDFEGSMNESIEMSFRQFGAKQIPYFTINKFNNKFLHLLKIFKK